MKLTPEELRFAYAQATATAGGHPSSDVLARLLAGEVTDDQRQKAVAHVAVCSRCAEEVRVASPVAESLSGGIAGARVLRPTSWARRGVLLAAAAAVLVAGGLALRVGRSPAPSTTFRAPSETEIVSALPAGASLPRNGAVLSWTGGPPGAAFDVVLANERLDVLARFPGVREPRLAVPASALASLPAGAKLVWRVTVVQPDGTRSETASFVTVVE